MKKTILSLLIWFVLSSMAYGGLSISPQTTSTGAGSGDMVLNTAQVVTASKTFGDGLLIATTPRITTGIKDANGVVIIGLTPTTTAVDYLSITNAATEGHQVELGVAGSDAAITLNITGKGTGKANIDGTAALNAPASGIALAALAAQAAESIVVNNTAGSASPEAVAIAAQQVVGRITGGHIKGLSTAEMQALLGIYDASSMTSSHYPYLNSSGVFINVTLGSGLTDTAGTLGLTTLPAVNGSALTSVNAATVTPAATTTNATYYLAIVAALTGSNTVNGVTGFTIKPSTLALNIPGALTVADATNNNYLRITNNASRAAVGSVNEIYPVGNVWLANQNGTPYSIALGPIATQINFSGTLTNGKACTWGTGGVITCNSDYAAPNADTTGLTAANVPAPTTIVSTGAISVTTKNTYVICTGACQVTLPVAAAGIQACVRNAPGGAYAITLVNRASQYYELTTHAAWATVNQKLVSGGVATDAICVVGYDATHYATMSYTGTWTDTP